MTDNIPLKNVPIDPDKPNFTLASTKGSCSIYVN